jgi:transposase InsO family protein
LLDQTRQTAVAFWGRAHAFFANAGISVTRVLTDNGSCYRSGLWRDTLATAGIAHKRIRPRRPQTNGTVERFNRTLLDEWAHARPYHSETERREALPRWLHTYNHHRRPHRTARPTTRQPRSQPHGALQLARHRVATRRRGHGLRREWTRSRQLP